ncbi:TonB-dependent receptor domain-containing protein [Sphingobacterium sp. E70]|uniref:TonB-dependent receptor domain-containing protein n=1 Tax=Sphingobacterium sp. E70 TaxID=2853439 RepID=UPI00359CAFAC
MGNDNIYWEDKLQEYQYFSTYSFGTYVVDDKLAKTLFESRVPNEMVTWEVANNYNLGFDFQFLQGKLNFEFDIFKNRRNSILWRKNASVPQSTGMTLPAENIGKVDNKGWEFNLGYKGKVGELGYTVGVNGDMRRIKLFSGMRLQVLLLGSKVQASLSKQISIMYMTEYFEIWMISLPINLIIVPLPKLYVRVI